MKTFFLTLSLFFVNFFNSQVIKIKVSEVMDSYGYDTSVLNVINGIYIKKLSRIDLNLLTYYV